MRFNYAQKVLLVCICFISACRDKISDSKNEIYNLDQGVYVLNEGNFGSANAGLDFYNMNTDNYYRDVFKIANNSILGDVAQDILLDGTTQTMFISVNNSSRLYVLNLYDLKIKMMFTGITSPRYIANPGNGFLYVTDIYANGIWKLDLSNGTVVKKIPVSGWSEAVLVENDHLWVSRPSENYINILDLSSDTWIDSIAVEKGVTALARFDSDIWALSGGGILDPGPSVLYRISGSGLNIKQSWPLLSQGAYRLTAGSRLYFLLGGSVYVMDNTLTAPVPLIQSPAGKNYYGLGYNSSRQYILALDAGDYVRRGTVDVYNESGELLQSVESGYIPSKIGTL
jgi:hypothetical protein